MGLLIGATLFGLAKPPQFVEHRVVEQDVAPRAERDLRAYLLPELVRREMAEF
uniref:hypothetical protein n=1 Tax=Hymenobacter frigidus TaxID=1524095 RepID=UPI001E53ED4A|nr:hypothetical protein [Hymenobacter frigidus]